MIKTRKYEVDRPKNPPNFNTRYSEKQKYEAVALFKMLGSVSLVSTNLGIPEDTIRTWKAQDWWKDYEYEVAQSDRAKTSKKLLNIRDKAMEVVMDRLESGDILVHRTKAGEVVFTRKPVDANIANKILQNSIEKDVLLEKLNQERNLTTATEKIADRLLIIQERFKQMVSKTTKRSEPLIIDAEVVEVPSTDLNPIQEVLDGSNEETVMSQDAQTPGEGQAPAGESGNW